MKASPKNKKSKIDIIIRVLAVACIVCAVALIGVLVMAFIGGGNENVTSGNVTPDNIQTTDPVNTTLADINNNYLSTAPLTQDTTVGTTAPAQRLVYATEEANVRIGASTDDEIINVIPEGESAVLVSVDEEGWCRVIYDSEVGYIHRDYLTLIDPATVTTAPTDTSTGRKIINPNQPLWLLLVVDKTRQMPEGYVPNTTYIVESDEELDSRIAPYYEAMYQAALKDGITLTPISGYRTYSGQESNYNDLVEEYINDYDMTREEAEAEAATAILPAGCSEHNLGLAVDIISLEYDFIYTEEYEWLAEHAHEYGFIERYTEEKQDITGIMPEPWHWRFVGKFAEPIKNSGLCLEEYLQHYGIQY